ncbi:MAG: hypothetical protein H6Q77_892 [Gemmatimonadetes bacterium]|jgi:hypothetical protein|nr:hypothetical protein [Gemmatimonadota bacterium]
MQRSLRSFLALGALALVATTAQAQVLSNTPTVTLNATQLPTLTVTVSTPSVSIASLNVGNNDFPGVNVTTAWNLGTAGTLQLVGWFAVPAAALSDGGTNNIPSSSVLGQVNGGTYTAFTGAAVGGVGVAGGSLSLFSAAVGVGIGNRVDALGLRLALASAPPAGAYTGTLNLRAIVQ